MKRSCDKFECAKYEITCDACKNGGALCMSTCDDCKHKETCILSHDLNKQDKN